MKKIIETLEGVADKISRIKSTASREIGLAALGGSEVAA
jgi:hypothetical protein